MKPKLAIALALAAGFPGGLASRYASPTPVFAQGQTPPTAEIKTEVQPEIRAQRFILVDEKGVARGVLGFERNGVPALEITNAKGHVFTTRLLP